MVVSPAILLPIHSIDMKTFETQGSAHFTAQLLSYVHFSIYYEKWPQDKRNI
jgi:hypothetical protein